MVQKSGIHSPVDMVILSHSLQGFIHVRWLAGFLPSTGLDTGSLPYRTGWGSSVIGYAVAGATLRHPTAGSKRGAPYQRRLITEKRHVFVICPGYSIFNKR